MLSHCRHHHHNHWSLLPLSALWVLLLSSSLFMAKFCHPTGYLVYKLFILSAKFRDLELQSLFALIFPNKGKKHLCCDVCYISTKVGTWNCFQNLKLWTVCQCCCQYVHVRKDTNLFELLLLFLWQAGVMNQKYLVCWSTWITDKLKFSCNNCATWSAWTEFFFSE